jgi:restriction endonuclease S subunit
MPFIREQIEANAGGSTVGTYTIETACKTRIFNPPMEEQQAFLSLVQQSDKSKYTLENTVISNDIGRRALWI